MAALNRSKRCLVLLVVPLVLSLAASAQEVKPSESALTLRANDENHEVNVTVPRGWSVAPQMFQNSRTLIDVAPGESRNPSARVQVYVEPRRDHADALKQMQEFASVVSEEDKLFTTIGGWPALQIRRIEWRQQPGEDRQHPDPKVLRLQTYVAVGDKLVVADADLPSDASSDLIAKTVALVSSLGFESAGDPAAVEEELRMLQAPDPAPGATPPRTGAVDFSTAPDLVGGGPGTPDNTRINTAGFGELEIAVSPDGQTVVVALQGAQWVSSQDGGATFSIPAGINFGNGDPSVAYGQSGNFYIAGIDSSCIANYLTFNVGALPPQPFGYDCTGIARSTDNGLSFQTNTVNPAAVCIGRAPAGGTDPPGACFPDQEHIAADRVNAGGGGDQVYSTWRNFLNGPTNAGLVCSQDSGVNWTAPISLGGNSFFPRIAVGQDGFVYVAAFGGGFYRIWKYDSCANGLGLVAGFPKNVVARDPFQCPFAGHDRCDQNPSSQTVAVDDTDADHIYYAYAEDDGTAGSDSTIFVRDSEDGGENWPAGRVVQASANVDGRRIFPWLCTTGGDAVVTWYEQREAVPSDTTDVFGARVGLSFFDSLVTKEVFQISEVSDNWCDIGWQCSTRMAPDASESCPIQPQLAGVCGDGASPQNFPGNVPCDFSDCGGFNNNAGPPCQCGAPAGGLVCSVPPRAGCPKYGDYNGNACAGGKLFFAWPSANAPSGVAPPNTLTNPGVLFDVINLDGLQIPVITIPGSVNFGETCGGEIRFADLEVCNTGSANLQVDVITSSDPQFAVTVPSSGFPVTISPDFCFPFEVSFTPSGTGPVSGLLTVPSSDPSRPSVDVDVTGIGEQQEIVTVFDGEFGNVCLEEVSTQELLIQNSGGCDLTVSNVSSSNAEFVLATTMDFPLVIAPGGEVTVPVEFAPAGDTNAETSTISIVHDGGNTASPKQLAASGTSEDAVIGTFLANNGAFGEVCAGDLLDLDLTVQNNGACPLEIDAVSIVLGANAQPGDFQAPAGGATGSVVEPGNSVQIPVRFSPAAFDGEPPATRMASVEVASHTQFASSALPTAATPIDGVVPPPDIQVAIANSGEFGNVCKNELADLDLTLFNQGRCDLTIFNIELTPDPGSFELPADLTFPLVLSPDADFRFPVRYAPEECSDVPEMRTVEITSDDPDEMTVDVTVSATSACPNLVIDPSGLSGLFAFPPTVVDTSGTLGCFSERSLTLRNNGQCPLTIDGISAAGADFLVTEPSEFPVLLPSGEETLSVAVRFTPQADADPLAPSEVTGQLTVLSDDPDGAGLADLCGESVAQSGVRILVTDQSGPEPVPVGEVDTIRIMSHGIHSPGPISLRYRDQPLSLAVVCGNDVPYHVDQESLPSTDTTGSDPNSSYDAKAKEGNLQTTESFGLGQCEFREFQLQLEDADSPECLLLPTGAPCTNDGQCCSTNCRGNNTCG